eukprot:TRINITY_DN23307_c0_g1_i1.p1 TRINITY_DN23307_c0_g1~~TRINITY_DN23307_c0_g1_i1.p1  ORF type:complete len:678 (+),score=96.03 TRINITY_DN23307_c0_g1_i1:211-2244(+)
MAAMMGLKSLVPAEIHTSKGPHPCTSSHRTKAGNSISRTLFLRPSSAKLLLADNVLSCQMRNNVRCVTTAPCARENFNVIQNRAELRSSSRINLRNRSSLKSDKGRPTLVAALSSGAASADSEALPGTVVEAIAAEAVSPSTWPDIAESLKGGSRGSIAGIDQSSLKDPKELADPDSLFAQFRGVEIHYKVAQPFSRLTEFDEKVLGSEGTTMIGAPAVLMHGFGASVFSWQRVVRPVASLLGAPVLAFDRPAFGLTSRVKPPGGGPWGSTPPENNPYSLEFSVAALQALVDVVLLPEKSPTDGDKEAASPPKKAAILIAHSAAAAVAVKSALEFPDKCLALVLVAPALFAPSRGKAKAKSSPPSDSSSDTTQSSAHDLAEKAVDAKLDEELERPRRGNPFVRALKAVATILVAAAMLAGNKAGLFLFWILGKVQATGELVEKEVEKLGVKFEEALSEKGDAVKSVAGGVQEVGRRLWGLVKAVLSSMLLFVFWLGENLMRALRAASVQVRGAAGALWAAGLRSGAGLWLVRQAINFGGVRAVKQAWHEPSACSQLTIEGYTQPMKCRDWDRAMVEFVIANSMGESMPLARRLQELACPVLVMTGDDDRLVPAWNSRNVAHILGVPLKVIPNCGHLPHEEKPEEFLALLRTFILEDVLKAGRGTTEGVHSSYLSPAT